MNPRFSGRNFFLEYLIEFLFSPGIGSVPRNLSRRNYCRNNSDGKCFLPPLSLPLLSLFHLYHIFYSICFLRICPYKMVGACVCARARIKNILRTGRKIYQSSRAPLLYPPSFPPSPPSFPARSSLLPPSFLFNAIFSVYFID